jgi:hypothetical protein
LVVPEGSHDFRRHHLVFDGGFEMLQAASRLQESLADLIGIALKLSQSN